MPGYIKVLRWLLAAEILLMLAVMGLQCVAVYLSPEPFTRELAAEKLLPMVGVCVAGAFVVILGSMLQRRYAIKEVRSKMSAENRLRLIKKRIVNLPDEAVAEEKRRRIMLTVIYALTAVCAAAGGSYFLSGDNFTSWDLETVMGDMLMHVLPWTAAAFLLAYIGLVLRDISMEKELVMLKNVSMPGSVEESHASKSTHVGAVRIVLLIAAVVLSVLGVFNGGARDVLVKAINICTECIGLG